MDWRGAGHGEGSWETVRHLDQCPSPQRQILHCSETQLLTRQNHVRGFVLYTHLDNVDLAVSGGVVGGYGMLSCD